MKKVITGSILAAGVAASLFGAGTAQAAPGVSVSVDGQKPVGIGDQKLGSGASAASSKGNASIAVSLLGPAHADTQYADGKGNIATTLVGGLSVVSGPGDRNTAVSVGGINYVGSGSDNHTFTAFGMSTTDSTSKSVDVSVCGTAIISAQGTVNNNLTGAPCKS